MSKLLLPLTLTFFLFPFMPGACQPQAEIAISGVTTRYQGSNQIFPNPERGFYAAVNPEGQQATKPLSLESMQRLKARNITLLRRIYLLSDFRYQPLSAVFLNQLNQDFETARRAGIKLIIRFSYNWLGGGPDATQSRILAHLTQLEPILQTHYDVIAFMEAGFIGDWGEWHSSSHEHVDAWTLDVMPSARVILSKILAVLPPERMVAMRYSKHKQQIFNQDAPLTLPEAFNGSGRSRTGFHNDAFRRDINDGGTYGPQPIESIERVKDWVSRETRYVIQGGELPSIPSDDPTRHDCPGTLADLRRMHWSVMNRDVKGAALKHYQTWEDQGCMAEIERQLGYRLQLTRSIVPRQVAQGEWLTLQLELVNQGWANPYNPRRVEIILRDRQTLKEYFLPLSEDPRHWRPGETQVIQVRGRIPADIVPGDYDAFLNLPDPLPQLRQRPEYSIRLANQNTWEAKTGYNNLQAQIRIGTASASQTAAEDNTFQLRDR